MTPQPKRPQLTVFTSRGASLLEITVAMSIVAISALAAGSFFSQQMALTRNLTRNSSCKAALSSQLTYIRQMTAIAPGYEWAGLSTGQSGLSITVSPGTIGDKWVDDDVRLQKVKSKDIVDGGAIKDLNTHLLQKGAVGFLAALYNSVPGISTTGVDFSSISHKDSTKPLPAPVDTENLKDFKSELRITTFNLGTGDEVASGTDLYLRPQGLNPPALTAAKIGQFPANTAANLGYRVHLRGTFTDPAGSAQSCEATDDFFYPIDLESPKLTVLLNVYDSATNTDSIAPYDEAMANPRQRAECSHTSAARENANLRLEIGFKTTVPAHQKIDSGTIFLCRDRSEQMNPNYCPGAVNAAMNGHAYTAAQSNAAPWIPCHEVTVCGMKAASATFMRDAPGAIRYVLNYDQSTRGSFPDGLWGCDVKVDVATVDAAGNFERLSDRAHPIFAGAKADMGRYYQPAPCYACYKKKPFSILPLLGIIAIGALTGGVGAGVAAAAAAASAGVAACATGIGGACKLKGYNFKGNKCAIPSGYKLNTGKRMCRRANPKFPEWFKPGIASGVGGKACAAFSGAYKLIPSKSYSFPATPSGDAVTDSAYDIPAGVTCGVSAICDNGVWKPEEDQPAIATCSRFFTAWAMDKDFSNDQKVCVMEIPVGQESVLRNKGYYSQFDSSCFDYNGADLDGSEARCKNYPTGKYNPKCSGAGCFENYSQVCQMKNLKTGRFCHGYPTSALNSGARNAKGPHYYFTAFDPTADVNLNFCDTTENEGD